LEVERKMLAIHAIQEVAVVGLTDQELSTGFDQVNRSTALDEVCTA
jgi:hypothetical protein